MTSYIEGELCPVLVEALIAAMRRGAIIPPVLVRFGRRDDRFFVLDGLHRTAASLLLGFDMIPATVIDVRYGGKRYERRRIEL
jgi:ParB-like chromosome segregation protein Spo0J